MKSLYEYLRSTWILSCCNCGATDNLIADPDVDNYVCEYCAKNSYINEELEVTWCEGKHES